MFASINILLYFEQLRLVQEMFADSETRTRVFARLDWIVQSLTIAAQLFITGRVATKLGLAVLLVIVPMAMVFGFLILAVEGTFIIFCAVLVLRRVGEYAFVRPGREMLWSRLGDETKYKAKCLIDVPVYRGADALVAQATSNLQSGAVGPSGIAMIGAVVAALGLLNAWWLGKRHDGTAATDAKVTESAAATSGKA